MFALCAVGLFKTIAELSVIFCIPPQFPQFSIVSCAVVTTSVLGNGGSCVLFIYWRLCSYMPERIKRKLVSDANKCRLSICYFVIEYS